MVLGIEGACEPDAGECMTLSAKRNIKPRTDSEKNVCSHLESDDPDSKSSELQLQI